MMGPKLEGAMRPISVAGAIAVPVCFFLGCAERPALPKSLSFEGVRVERAADWKEGSVSGVVLVPPAEDLETASLQIGVLAGRGPYSAPELHRWVMDHYYAAPMERWHEAATANGACKIGLVAEPRRPFVALHLCRSGVAGTSCVEADERLDESVVRDCESRGAACWEEVCNAKRDAWLPALEALVNGVVDPQGGAGARDSQ